MKKRIHAFLSISMALFLLFSILLPAAAITETTGQTKNNAGETDENTKENAQSETPETVAPACAETGEHMFDTYVFLENGRHAAVCTLCGETFESDCEYPEPHVYKNNENGTHSEFCALCGGERILDCEYEDAVTLPTQTEAGATTHTCTVCGYVFTDSNTEPEAERKESAVMGDLNRSGAVEADDARALLRAAVSLEDIPDALIPYADLDFSGDVSAADARLALRTAVGLESVIRHDYATDVQNNAACEKTGKLTCVCGYCQDSSEIEIPATGHDYKLQNRVAPTCTKDGVEKYACTVCKKTKDVKLRAAGHQYTETRKEPTCTKEGSIINVCSVCGDKTVEAIPATGHQFVETRKEPTCTENGSVTNVCSVCGETRTEELPATGHKWVAATAATPKHCELCGLTLSGWNEENGKIYYYNADGTLPKGKTVVYATFKGVEGYWYLENGVLDLTSRCGVTVNGTNWIVTEGKARKAVSESDKTLFRAFQAVEKATTPNMTKAEKLKACFDYVKTAYKETRPRTPHYLGADWTIIYANDMFVRGKGNCCSYAAAFAFMAKALGYENVYGCNSGGHGWAEIDGLIYDPEWSKGHGTAANHYYFGITYAANYGVNYKIIKNMNTVYSHVKI